MTRLLLPVAVAFVALLVACGDGGGGGPTPTAEVTPAETASPEPQAETPTPGESPTPGETETPAAGETPAGTPAGELGVCQPNPDPATPATVQVITPAPGESVTSPVTISGRIAVSEAQFNITIFDAAGNAIVDVPGRSKEGFVLSPFSADIPFSVSEPTPACIWVYDISERDGSPIQVAQIPVTLLP